jgi:protein-S-isoprenylcysteine O-methyltransferase Ste14
MDSIELLTRFCPAAFFLGIAAYYTGRILHLRARLGRSPVDLGQRGTEAARISLVFRVFRMVILLAMVARAVWPEVDAWLVPIRPLWYPGAMLAGNLVMALAFAGVLGMHCWTGDAWRSGIDRAGEGRLWTAGPYRYLRHPMFALVLLGQAGLFLAVPSAFTAVCLAVGVATILAQARLEEIALQHRFGHQWQEWAAATPAWPWSIAGCYLARHCPAGHEH